MANRTIYTRTYSSRSAGQLESGLGQQGTGNPLTRHRLIAEFMKHSHPRNKESTALVSVSNRIVDTVKRAFDKYWLDKDDPADIWIVFIEAPATRHQTTARIHDAETLAKEHGLEKSSRFQHEFLFEWAIPETYVLHKVSLRTLMDRGLDHDWQKYLSTEMNQDRPSTREVRLNIAKDLITSYSPGQLEGWDIGIYVGSFAQKFGARAPSAWIAHQLFNDCIRTKILRGQDGWPVATFRFGHGQNRFESQVVDLCEFGCEVERGIDDVLIEWWLATLDFQSKFKEFKELEEILERDIDLASWTKREHIRVTIEEEAVAIGL